MDKLPQNVVMEKLKSLPDWNLISEVMISRTYEFKDFMESINFVNKVAKSAEIAQHHPDIIINYNKVILNLCTHDAGGLSEKDFAMAVKADGLVNTG